MKKLLLLLLATTVVFELVSCQTENGNTNPGNNLEGDLESILEKIYKNAEVDESFKDFVENGLLTNHITLDNAAYHLGKEGIEFVSAIVSEPMMSTSAYSLCLVRVKEGADIEQIKTAIKENVDPMKWVCVGVDPDNIIVDNIGDVIFLLMSDFQTEALYNSFLGLKS